MHDGSDWLEIPSLPVPRLEHDSGLVLGSPRWGHSERPTRPHKQKDPNMACIFMDAE